MTISVNEHFVIIVTLVYLIVACNYIMHNMGNHKILIITRVERLEENEEH